MLEKLTRASLGLLVFGAVAIAPQVASASPLLTEGGTVVMPGATIRATNVGNFVFTAGATTMTCTNVKIDGSLVTNSGKLIQETIKTVEVLGPAGSEGHCQSTFLGNRVLKVTAENLHWCLETTGTDEFTIKGGGCNEAAKEVAFSLESTDKTINCTYAATQLLGTYKTNETPVTLSLSKQKFTKKFGSGFTCAESGELTATLLLETTAGTSLTIS
ncbi:MAG TPA: hypothetical protein VF125_07730 [Solirubrobacterales bacterium]